MRERIIDQPVDRGHFSIGAFGDENDEPAFWHRQSMIKRLEGIEFMRQVAYDYDADTERLQRVFEAAQCPWR